MRSYSGKIPKFQDVAFIAEEAIAIDSGARMEGEKRYLAHNIHTIEGNGDAAAETDGADWRVFPFEKTHRLKALLQLNQYEFVFNVFRALLGRNPNPEEMWTQVEVIRKNGLRKLAYIINLRGVEESKAYDSSFRDADRGFTLFGRFIRVANKDLGRIREIEIRLMGAEPIFSDADGLEERLERILAHYRSLVSYCKVVQEACQLEIEKARERSNEEVYLVDSPNFFEIGKKNGAQVSPATREKYPEDYHYYLFENAFYDPEVVRRKQSHYLPLLKHARASKRSFLDLGCGRGEFLNLLKGYGIEGVGVELNRIECEALKQSGIEVYRKDIFEFIAENEGLWSGVSLIHVIEHLDTNKTMSLYDDLYEMIEADGVLVIESINPHCPISFGSFYMDPTHRVPHTPEGVAFNMQRAGFRDVRILYSNLIDDYFWGPEKKANYHDFGVIGRK